MTKYAKLATGLVVAWFVFSLAASALHLYRNGPNQPPIAVGLAVSLPIVAFFVWFAASPGFRQFTLSLDPRLLTLVLLENRRLRLRRPRRLWPSARPLRLAGRLWRHLHRPHCPLRRPPARNSRSSRKLPRLASPRHHRSGQCGRARNAGQRHRSARYPHQHHDRASLKHDPHLRRPAAPHRAHHLYRAGPPLASATALAHWRAAALSRRIEPRPQSHPLVSPPLAAAPYR